MTEAAAAGRTLNGADGTTPVLGLMRRPLNVSGHRVRIAVVLALAFGFYVWTAQTSAPFSFSSSNDDVYNQLTDGFLHGHTYLPLQVPPGLLRLKDPYDPAQNAPYQSGAYHDLALRNGHFYTTWGPTPALTLFLPFRLTTLKMSESFAVVLYGFAGLVCAVLLLHLLIRRFLPGTRDWLLVAASAGLALSNVVPFILRRPAVYEVAIGSGYCFAMAGLLLIARGMIGTSRRTLQLALGSLCLGLAIGGRPSLVPLGLVAVTVAAYVWRRGGEPRRTFVALLAPVIVCGLLLGAYDTARFGSPADFGSKWALAGIEQSKYRFDQLSYVPPGVFSYLLLPPRPALTFPHVFLMSDTSYPLALPYQYAGSATGPPAEPVGGLLPEAPITLLLAALPLWWRRRDRSEEPIALIAAGLTALGLLVVVDLAWGLFSTTERYEVDYASLLLIPAFLMWAALTARAQGRRRHQLAVATAGLVLTGIGAAVGTAISLTGYYDSLRTTHPGTFRTLEDVTSPLAAIATMVADKPVLTRVDDGSSPVDFPTPHYGTFGERGASSWLGPGQAVTVTVIAPGSMRTVLDTTALRGPDAPASARALAISIRSGGRGVTVPLGAPAAQLPIELHWGINRIELNVSGVKSAPPRVIRLDNIRLAGS